ncbi:phage tail protein, partial [Sphingomonas trueperi]|uniref:phage tail protein n=1 Tax=Sphingomonas trueperi TaxID=53317 RepID=UPI0031DDEB7B
MQQEFYTLLTDIGLEKLAYAQASNTAVSLKRMHVGTGGGSDFYESYNKDQLRSLSSLVDEKWSSILNDSTQDPDNPNWIVLEAVIPADTGGWMVREIGISDEDGDLIAVGRFPETFKPKLTDGAAQELVLRSIIEVSNSSSVSLSIDPSVVMATRHWVNVVAIPAALSSLDEKVALAASEADRAESARDAAQTASGIFTSVEAGESSTIADEYFWVTSENDEESLILYKRESEGSEEVKRYPAATESITQGWRGALDAGQGVERRVGDNPHSYTQSLAGGGPENRPSLDSSGRRTGSTGSTFRFFAPGIIARREMVNIRTNPVVMRVDVLTGNPGSVSEEWDGEYRAGVAWYRNNRNSLEDDPISIWKVDASAGQSSFYEDSFTFGPSGSGADVEAPSDAVYAIPFFEITGTTGAFLASRLEVRDNSVVENITAIKKSAKVAESEAQPG